MCVCEDLAGVKKTSLVHRDNDTKVDTHSSLGNEPHHTQGGVPGSRALRAAPGGLGEAGRGHVWPWKRRGRGLHSVERVVTELWVADWQGSWEEESRPSWCRQTHQPSGHAIVFYPTILSVEIYVSTMKLILNLNFTSVTFQRQELNILSRNLSKLHKKPSVLTDFTPHPHAEPQSQHAQLYNTNQSESLQVCNVIADYPILTVSYIASVSSLTVWQASGRQSRWAPLRSSPPPCRGLWG